MDDPSFFLTLLVPAIFIGVMGGASLLTWYRNKEEQDLKSVEFKIIAAENGLEYSEDGKTYYNRLSHHNLLPGDDVKFRNITSNQHPSFISRVFDVTHVIYSGETAKTQHLIGIAVEFESQSFPRFDLSKSEFFDGLTFFDEMKKINNKLLPDWLKNIYSLFYDKQSQPHEVARLFRDKSKLEKVLRRRYFHLLAGNSNILVIYLKGENKSDLKFYNNMERVAVSLAKLFAPTVNESGPEPLTDEINLIKRRQSPNSR